MIINHRTWRSHVIGRDKQCVCCHSTRKLRAHHIKTTQHYPELRHDVNNGATVCEECHLAIHEIKFYNSLLIDELLTPIPLMI